MRRTCRAFALDANVGRSDAGMNPSSDPGSALLEVRALSKSFGTLRALQEVDFTLRAGEIHALLGENGAGKSTLIKAVTGVFPRDAGIVRLGGAGVAPRSAKAAVDAGIATVYQEVNLLLNLSVAQNLYLGRQPTRFGLVREAEMRRSATELLAEFDLHIELAETTSERAAAQGRQVGEICARFENYGKAGCIAPFDLALRRGEVVGLAGLLGSGRTETARLVFGAERADSGSATVEGKPVRMQSPRDAVAHGFGYCPEERKTEGIIADLTVRENIVLALQAKRGLAKPLSRAEQEEIAMRFIRLLDIRPPEPERPIGLLSGGNQQKVLLARWLATAPRVLVLDEPTRGIDVGAHAEIIRLIRELCDDGLALLVISSELDEIVTYSDRVIVLRDRAHVDELEGDAHGLPLALAAALGAGLLCGLWNGFLVAVLGIQPIVATLILMVAGRGVAQLITEGRIVTFTAPDLVWLGNGAVLGVPAPVVVVVGMLIVTGAVVRGSALGLLIEATGGNARASELAGIGTRGMILAVYVWCGLCAALAGVIAAADIMGADANNAGLWLELDAILAVVIGGTSLFGGRFSLVLAMVGALIIQAMNTGILLSGYPPEFNLLVKAVVVLVVLLLQSPRFANAGAVLGRARQ